MKTDKNKGDAEQQAQRSSEVSVDGGTRLAGRGDALSGNVYQQIRNAIISGELAPGQRVTETKLADSLNVSRTPIREAVQRLETEGVLRHSPRQGLTVRQLEYQEVVELYAMRLVLESTAAGLSAQQATDPEIEILTDIVEMESAALEDDPKQSVNYNKIFHETLAQSAHNRYLIDSIRALDNSMILLGGSTLAEGARRKQAVDEHRAIVDAIRAHDPDAARDAMALHIKGAQRKRLQMFMRSQTG
ncbi:GntR family transcriptional regulator [Hwanghaeella sp.]|uniref:GntR family transcriptional regulator n=1 Tax=Hwanghaeella sp. TaxID=2605943 RepID=UPI003CCBB361